MLQAVAFVKGTRFQPQCGFSYKVLSMLTELRADFEVVNVLDEQFNPGVRNAIKEYSQWPTVPQVCDTHCSAPQRCWCHIVALAPQYSSPELAAWLHVFCCTIPDLASLGLVAVVVLLPTLAHGHCRVLMQLLALQVYIGGEFLGGADIVEEMHGKGELKAALQKAGACM